MATRHRHRHHRTRWPRQTPAASQRNSAAVTDVSTASPWTNKRKKHSRCQEQKQEEEDYAGPSLPEDIWCHIYSLLPLPLRDAAQAACVSHAFRSSWRRLPSLTFSEDSLSLTRHAAQKEGISGDFARKVDNILKNRSRAGLRTLELHLARYNVKDHGRLDRWLKMTVGPCIEKITVSLTSKHGIYRFPCSLLSDGMGDSVRHLRLSNCSFCPTAGRWSSRNLAVLDLSSVDITGNGLWCLLSSSIALERVLLRYCSGITCLEIPGSLRRLGHLEVVGCDDLQAIESKAPNLSVFNFVGDHLQTRISLGGELRVKELHMDCSGYPWFTRAKLASRSTPDPETVNVIPSTKTIGQLVGTSSKSSHLERLYIEGVGKTPFYLSIKYCALVSLYGPSYSVEDLVSYMSSQLTDHVLFCGAKRSGISVVEEQLVDGASRMLKAWLS